MKKSQDTDDNIEASEANYLYTSPSQIPNSGLGLMTAIPIYKDEVISLFKGEILTTQQVKLRIKKGNDKYFIKLLNGTIMDSMRIKCFAKYANDAEAFAISGFKNNAKIAFDENNNICLIATRNIKTNEEIFCSYGKKYWENQMK